MLAVASGITDRQALLDTLRRQVQQLEKASRPEHAQVVSTGCAAVDRLLPQSGFARGTLIEWFTAQAGAGAFTLALALARAATQEGGLIVISNPPRRKKHSEKVTSNERTYPSFYAPAAAALGLNLEQIVVLNPPNAAEELWALDQALRSEGVVLAWASLPKLGDHDFRRLQLAAEAGGTIGFLGRPARARGQPAWSDLQLLVEPQVSARGNRRLRMEVVRIRGGVAGASVLLEIDDITGQVREAIEHHETHPVPQISGLAPAATRRRQA